MRMVTVNSAHVQEAIDVLRRGGVVVFPSETSYGLAADARDVFAVERVAVIKGRATEKTFPIIAANRAMAEQCAVLSPSLSKLADRFWPGPLTIVAPVQEDAGLEAVTRNATVAIRVSSGEIAALLSEGLGGPIVATSANRAGEQPEFSIAGVKKQFSVQPLQPEYYLDAGVLPSSKPSTIIREVDGNIEVLREGALEVPTHLV